MAPNGTSDPLIDVQSSNNGEKFMISVKACVCRTKIWANSAVRSWRGWRHGIGKALVDTNCLWLFTFQYALIQYESLISRR